MADIPIERRSGGRWWKWLLGLLVLALAIWLIASWVDTGNEEVGGAVDEQVEEPVEESAGNAAGEPVTSLATIQTASNQRDFVGQDVQLTNVNVPSVVGDSAFYVTSNDSDERVLVVFDKSTQIESGAGVEGGANAEGEVNLRAGQTIRSLEGSLEELATADLRQWNLDIDREAKQGGFYIRASRINISAAG